jgi:anti-sigma B factor antagonist
MARIDISMEKLPDGIHVVKPSGKLDVFSYLELKQVLETLSAATRDLKVVVDLSATEYIASSGWSVLLSRRRSLKIVGGDLSICGLTDETKRVYDSMKIHTILPVADTVTQAAQLLA